MHMRILVPGYLSSKFVKRYETRYSLRDSVKKLIVPFALVCYTAVFSVVTQCSLRDDTKNGCVADYVRASLLHEEQLQLQRSSSLEQPAL